MSLLLFMKLILLLIGLTLLLGLLEIGLMNIMSKLLKVGK